MSVCSGRECSRRGQRMDVCVVEGGLVGRERGVRGV